MATKKAYVFFNCDDEKSDSSMNLRYNDEVFQDTKVARKLLLKKVKYEVSAGRVAIDKDKENVLSDNILTGDPTKATELMKYGAIVAVSLH